jgi:hypothetical protein
VRKYLGHDVTAMRTDLEDSTGFLIGPIGDQG